MLAVPAKGCDVLVVEIRDRRGETLLSCPDVLGVLRERMGAVEVVISIWRGRLHCCWS